MYNGNTRQRTEFPELLHLEVLLKVLSFYISIESIINPFSISLRILFSRMTFTR